MKKSYKLLLLFLLWSIILIILNKTGTLPKNADELKNMIVGEPFKMQLIFVLLSTIRVLFFIPQTIFILLGSLLFGPYIGFSLSMISLFLSQSIMYVVGRYFNKELLGEDFTKKNNHYIDIVKSYGYKILALGIVCPITPSDLFTAISGCIKLSYKKSLAVILLADAPMIFLYGFLGSNIEGTFFFKVFAVLIIAFISYYSFTVYNKISALKAHA